MAARMYWTHVDCKRSIKIKPGAPEQSGGLTFTFNIYDSKC
jgi:hypothetical protein